LNIILHPELSTFMQGLIGAIDLIGIAIGSIIFGRLSDKYGYLLFFRLCPALIFVSCLVAILFPSVAVLTVSLFFVGLGIGGEYSLDSDYVSELMPVKYRALMVGVAKAACALGNIIVAAICFGLIEDWKSAEAWPKLLWIIAIIAGVMFLLRLKFYESPKWLLDHDQKDKAEIAVKKFLGPDVVIEPEAEDVQPTQKATAAPKTSLLSFIGQNWKKVILSGIPWACEGLGVYGIGVFLPILVMALGLEHFTAGENPIFHVASSVKITLWISCIILPGFILGLYLINKKKSLVAIQSIGFWMCAVSLVILLLSYHYGWNKWISIGAFMAFELFLNMGPHLITYVLPPHIYPVAQRGQGVGLAASIGKIGAVLGVFVIPILLKSGGALLVLIVSAAVMVAGALVTNIFGKEVNQ
ncbi:MAG: sugar porter family MFS transporter, partial [Muribaculaceae bacterium]|nr:sugar porter family MFS transporter [Muribaculaceae bacterium]